MATISSTDHTVITEAPHLTVRKVDSEASMRWLNAGIKDFKASLGASITYGMVYVVLGLILAWLSWANPIFVTSLATGFLILGPIVAVGFYCMSRTLEQGNKPHFSQGIDGLRFNGVSLASFAMVLGVLMGIWAVISSVTVAMFFNNVTIADNWLDTLIGHEQFVPFLFVWALSGAAVAAVAFSISVISVPLITDKRVDVITAIITSVKAVMANPGVMLSWAFILATLMFLGFIFFFVGLAITLPIAGHASWHAYRDLIAEE
jgi:Predicted integral membrane protein